MAQTQIADVVVPAEFTAYQVELYGVHRSLSERRCRQEWLDGVAASGRG